MKGEKKKETRDVHCVSQVSKKPALLTTSANRSDMVTAVYAWECASVNFQYLVNLLFPSAHQEMVESFCLSSRKTTHSAFFFC